jgi:hypothetical protein
LPEEEVARVEAIEEFDEHEEWVVKCQHYFSMNAYSYFVYSVFLCVCVLLIFLVSFSSLSSRFLSQRRVGPTARHCRHSAWRVPRRSITGARLHVRWKLLERVHSGRRGGEARRLYFLFARESDFDH